MKKILFIVVAFLATSCEYVPSGYIPKEIGYEYEVNISEIEHEGHSYLLFDGYGVVHNPNCKCTKKED
jgi:hypothetical protein